MGGAGDFRDTLDKIGETDFMQLAHCLCEFGISCFTDSFAYPVFSHRSEKSCYINEDRAISDLNAGTSLNWIEYNFMHCQ
jgi:hypothetical protein